MLGGCVPWPHHQRRAPALSGVLRSGDAPLPGIAVHRTVNAVPASAAPQCLGEEVVRTDGEGRFVFPEQEDLLFFIVFGDRLDTWSLCFEDAAGRVFVWTDSGWWGGPGEQTLDCSLDPKTEMPCRALSPEGD